MRYRERGSFHSHHSSLHNEFVRYGVRRGDNSIVWTDDIVDTLSEGADAEEGFSDAMWDEVSTGHRRPDHPCVHQTTVKELFPILQEDTAIDYVIGGEHGAPDPDDWVDTHCTWTMYADKGFWITPVPEPDLSLPRLNEESEEVITALSDKISDALVDHLDRCRNPLSKSISIANFLLEIDDIKRSAKTLLKLFKNPSISEQILNYSFGVAPLLRDIGDLYNTIDKTRKSIAWMRRNQNKPVRISTTREFDDPRYEESSVNFPGPSESSGTLSVFGYLQRPPKMVIKFTTWVEYDFDRMSDWELTLLAATRSLNLANPLQIAWNATRLSFVVDWFVNISRALERFDLTNAFINARVSRSTSSIQSTKITNCYTSSYDGGFSDRRLIFDMETARVTQRCYQRWVGIPHEWQSLIDVPSLRELMLLVLLGVQKLPYKARTLFDFPRHWLKPKRLKKRPKWMSRYGKFLT